MPIPATKHVTKKGYFRIMARGPHRNKLLHRAVILEAIRQQRAAGIPVFVPTQFEVHHIDRDKRHNCIENLMILEPAIHAAIEQSHKRYLTGRFAEE